jgi:acyl carrier protein
LVAPGISRKRATTGGCERMDIVELLQEVSGRPIRGLDSSLLLSKIAGWDSLAMVRLMVQLEQLLGRELAEDELGALMTVGDVQRLLGGA